MEKSKEEEVEERTSLVLSVAFKFIKTSLFLDDSAHIVTVAA